MIKLEQFKKYIDSIKEKHQFQIDLDNISDKYRVDYFGVFPGCEDELVSLLELVMGDDDSWISYWIYDLNFGRKYLPGMVKFGDENIPLETVEDLYGLLIEKR